MGNAYVQLAVCLAETGKNQAALDQISNVDHLYPSNNLCLVYLPLVQLLVAVEANDSQEISLADSLEAFRFAARHSDSMSNLQHRHFAFSLCRAMEVLEQANETNSSQIAEFVEWAKLEAISNLRKSDFEANSLASRQLIHDRRVQVLAGTEAFQDLAIGLSKPNRSATPQ